MADDSEFNDEVASHLCKKDVKVFVKSGENWLLQLALLLCIYFVFLCLAFLFACLALTVPPFLVLLFDRLAFLILCFRWPRNDSYLPVGHIVYRHWYMVVKFGCLKNSCLSQR